MSILNNQKHTAPHDKLGLSGNLKPSELASKSWLSRSYSSRFLEGY